MNREGGYLTVLIREGGYLTILIREGVGCLAILNREGGLPDKLK